jgi:hypothetical protein
MDRRTQRIADLEKNAAECKAAMEMYRTAHEQFLKYEERYWTTRKKLDRIKETGSCS